MRLKALLICTVSLYVSAAQVPVAARPKDRCTLPPGLAEEIAIKYPGENLVKLTDLSEYNRKLFQEDHDDQCPGLVRVNFYGDGKPTWALVLIAGESPKRKAELLVAHQVAEGWEIRSLVTTDGTPVVWREAPGRYDDLYGKKTIRARNPVIVLVGYESSEVVFAWTGKEVERVQISD
jgi:hypothetical protein